MADGKALVNVVKCIVTNESTNVALDIGDTASQIEVEPILSAGKRDILRVKNKILGINQTEDIAIGYKLKLTDNTFNIDVMALVDGGTISGNTYTSIPAGEVVDKDLFTLTVYTEEKSYSRTTGYTKFEWKHCKGKVPKYKIKDGDFIVPEFEAESVPYKGETAVGIVTGLTSIPGDSSSDTTSDKLAVIGGTVTGSNPTVDVTITSNIKWTFAAAINQDEVTTANFFVVKKSDSSAVAGSLTIDTTKTIVTFVPTSVEVGAIYTATANAVALLDASGDTTAISVDFTTTSAS